MIDRLKELIGRKLYLEISGNRQYNGQIESVDETDSKIHFRDKYGDLLIISTSIIEFMQPKDTQNPKGNSGVVNSSCEVERDAS